MPGSIKHLTLFCAGCVGHIFFIDFFSYVILRLYPEFQCSTVPGTGHKVCAVWCGGGV